MDCDPAKDVVEERLVQLVKAIAETRLGREKPPEQTDPTEGLAPIGRQPAQGSDDPFSFGAVECINPKREQILVADRPTSNS